MKITIPIEIEHPITEGVANLKLDADHIQESKPKLVVAASTEPEATDEDAPE